MDRINHTPMPIVNAIPVSLSRSQKSFLNMDSSSSTVYGKGFKRNK